LIIYFIIFSSALEAVMLTIEQIDTGSAAQVNRFIQFHYDLYRGTPQWVPPFYSDIRLMLNRKKHPFYEHSDGDFFLATRGKEVVGRLAIMENRPFNQYHKTAKAQFYLFDTINDLEVPQALFARAAEWCKARGLNEIVGPKGFSAFDGYGIQVAGFEHRQMMTMMNYNFDYYPKLIEAVGFTKEVDFVSTYLDRDHFNIPDKFREVARRVRERGKFKVVNFKTKGELKQWASRIGEAYNKAFVNNWEYYPLSDGEIKFILDNLLVVAVPRFIKLITYDDKVVGFLLGFPDISAALQRQGGRITPWGLVDIFSELKKTKFISLNGVGVLPEYHGRGGNTLLYEAMADLLMDSQFDAGELTQMAETAIQVRKDIITAGTVPWKNHRIYHKTL
jgi:GNAT superfamily N-acetyltransferase